MYGEVKIINGKRIATTEYRSWQMMKNRCLNPRAEDYRYYGARGITVCEAWLLYDNFLADMGRKPNPLMTLERLDNDLGYFKENCEWATRRQQAQNRGYYNVLDNERAEQIRKKYATGDYYQYELAEIYGITPAHVSQIVRNVCWRKEDTR